MASTGFGGTATGVLQFDDQTLALAITLAPAVSAHGVVYHPPPGDVWNGDTATLTPEGGAIVQIRDSGGQLQVVTTGADGAYRFAVLRTGAYTISATDAPASRARDRRRDARRARTATTTRCRRSSSTRRGP